MKQKYQGKLQLQQGTNRHKKTIKNQTNKTNTFSLPIRQTPVLGAWPYSSNYDALGTPPRSDLDVLGQFTFVACILK